MKPLALVLLLIVASVSLAQAPWLSEEETAKVKKAWPPFWEAEWPPNLKLYSLSRKYQRLYTMNNGRFKGRDMVELEDTSLKFAHSGGLKDFVGWTSVKGLALPKDKKILVWMENTDVRAFALVPRWRWSFPEGTVAVDALFNSDGKIFEIRSQTKGKKDWTSKVVYKNPNNFPAGYKGLKQSCASCHDNAGRTRSNLSSRHMGRRRAIQLASIR